MFLGVKPRMGLWPEASLLKNNDSLFLPELPNALRAKWVGGIWIAPTPSCQNSGWLAHVSPAGSPSSCELMDVIAKPCSEESMSQHPSPSCGSYILSASSVICPGPSIDAASSMYKNELGNLLISRSALSVHLGMPAPCFTRLSPPCSTFTASCCPQCPLLPGHSLEVSKERSPWQPYLH